MTTGFPLDPPLTSSYQFKNTYLNTAIFWLGPTLPHYPQPRDSRLSVIAIIALDPFTLSALSHGLLQLPDIVLLLSDRYKLLRLHLQWGT